MHEWLSWWSTTLPRSGPRVRVPSRARINMKKGYPNGYPFFMLPERSRYPKVRGLRFAPVVAEQTSTGRFATSRALSNLSTLESVHMNPRTELSHGLSFASFTTRLAPTILFRRNFPASLSSLTYYLQRNYYLSLFSVVIFSKHTLFLHLFYHEIGSHHSFPS